MRNIDIIIFIFTDEASECGDASSATISTNRKHQDWAAQVESEQQQETDYNTDSMIQPSTVPRGSAGRGGRHGWRRGKPPVPNREGVLTTNIFCFLLFPITHVVIDRMSWRNSFFCGKHDCSA